jgi:hypothetical protein
MRAADADPLNASTLDERYNASAAAIAAITAHSREIYNGEQFYMDEAAPTARPREVALVCAAGALLAVLMTWPLAAGITHVGRTAATDADGQYSIWNIAWVAHAIVTDPARLYDANIFFPHRTTLAYSEANLLEGTLAVPVYWATKNPWLSLNVICLFAFASAFVCAYLFLKYLWSDPFAAAAGAIMYAFCPFVFSHLSHIQLLMTGGIPLSLLMLHRIADAPSLARGVALGAALAAQALSCAYYGVFAGMLVGYAVLLLATTRSLWRSAAYWTSVAAGAVVSILIVLPFFIPYLRVRAETGFGRTEVEALQSSANLQSYLVSASHAHAWLLAIARHFEHWEEPLFPGLMALGFGVAGIALAWRAAEPGRTRAREAVLVYGGAGLLAFWASFGPHAGLYKWLSVLPIFVFLRAPSRFGLIVVLTLAVFASFAIRALLARIGPGARRAVGPLLIAAAIGDLLVAPIRWFPAPARPSPYAALARLPREPLAEFPFYGERVTFPLHAQYMLFSTWHWMPLVNGYSDAIPADFRADAPILQSFPSREAFLALERHRVRYIAIHWDMFGTSAKAADARRRLQAFESNLRLIAADDRMSLYEVETYP